MPTRRLVRYMQCISRYKITLHFVNSLMFYPPLVINESYFCFPSTHYLLLLLFYFNFYFAKIPPRENFQMAVFTQMWKQAQVGTTGSFT